MLLRPFLPPVDIRPAIKQRVRGDRKASYAISLSPLSPLLSSDYIAAQEKAPFLLKSISPGEGGGRGASGCEGEGPRSQVTMASMVLLPPWRRLHVLDRLCLLGRGK